MAAMLSPKQRRVPSHRFALSAIVCPERRFIDEFIPFDLQVKENRMRRLKLVGDGADPMIARLPR